MSFFFLFVGFNIHVQQSVARKLVNLEAEEESDGGDGEFCLCEYDRESIEVNKITKSF